MHLAQHPSSQENDGEVSGTLAFHTSGVPCLSCVGVAAQFKRHYPRVRPLVCWMGWWNTREKHPPNGEVAKIIDSKVPVDLGNSFVYRCKLPRYTGIMVRHEKEIPIKPSVIEWRCLCWVVLLHIQENPPKFGCVHTAMRNEPKVVYFYVGGWYICEQWSKMNPCVKVFVLTLKVSFFCHTKIHCTKLQSAATHPW